MRAGLTLNYLLYQAGWFGCVLGAAAGYPWWGAMLGAGLIAVHAGLARRRSGELQLMLAVLVIGLAVDSAQIRLGTLRFTSGLVAPDWPPAWLIVLWAQFATTLNYSLRWLRDHPWRAAIFGAVGGPLAFFAGSRFGAVELTSPPWTSLVVLSVLWGAAMPLAARVAAHIGAHPGTGEYRRPFGRGATAPAPPSGPSRSPR